MGKMKHHLLLGFSLVSSAVAQSAANFDTKVITPAAAAPKVAPVTASPPSKTATTGTATPSRYVDETGMEAYLESLSSVFLAGASARDPFGHLQDPDAKPVIRASTTTLAHSAPVRATPLSEIIELISITTIIPGEKSFLVGTRKVKQGQELPLVFRGKTIRVAVTGVSARQITFKNLDSGETGTRELDMLPPGMRAGNEEFKAPGMIPDRPNAPIELDMGGNTP